MDYEIKVNILETLHITKTFISNIKNVNYDSFGLAHEIYATLTSFRKWADAETKAAEAKQKYWENKAK